MKNGITNSCLDFKKTVINLNKMSDKERYMKAEEDLRRLCNQILQSDSSVRFVGIPNKMGRQIISHYRNGLTLLLTPQEIEMFAIESVLRMNTRKDFESKLGKPIYSFTLYEKVKRATITLQSEDYPILMVSFDIQANHDYIIMNKILPIVRKEGL